MSKSKRELSPEEKRLWRRVATGLKPRRPLEPAEPLSSPPPPAKAVRTAPAAPKPPPAKPKPPAPPANRANELRVRRGKMEIDGTLDLHGHTQDTARAALSRYIAAAHARGWRTIIIVTGMGRGGEGVLKRRFPDWLAEADIRPLVAGFAPAHRTHGGAGAFYVFIKRKTADR